MIQRAASPRAAAVFFHGGRCDISRVLVWQASIVAVTAADSASAPADFTDTLDVLFHDGSTTSAYSIAVPIADDDVHENDEGFDLRLIPACFFEPCALATVDGRGTIENDDASDAGVRA